MKSVRITVMASIPDIMSLDEVAEGFNAILEIGSSALDDICEGEEYTEAQMYAANIEFPMSPTEVVPA